MFICCARRNSISHIVDSEKNRTIFRSRDSGNGKCLGLVVGLKYSLLFCSDGCNAFS